jgi:isoleucyl-tRNA synthetase
VCGRDDATEDRDVDVTHDLRREGVARELIRAIQDARRTAGLQVSDRIQLGVDAGAGVSGALTAHRDMVARETLAVDVLHGDADGPATETEIDGEPVRITVRRADYAAPPRA